MSWREFRAIFGPFLPAGSFRECLYFAPAALSALTRVEDKPLEFAESVIWWISSSFETLKSLGFADAVARDLRTILDTLCAGFEVQHFDRRACTAKGWTLDHEDIVKGSEVVAEVLLCLERGEVLLGIATAFIEDLWESDDPVSAAWSIEYARRSLDSVRPPIRAGERLISDAVELRRKLSIVRGSPFWMRAPVYWGDLVVSMGLEGV